MKKLLAIIACALSMNVMAAENVTIYYAWTASDSIANYSRALAMEANKIQNKYTFIFDTKPGAGGAIAANHVLREPNSVVAHSTAFFVRPVVFPNESYDINQFRPLWNHCTSPMIIASSKYKSWKDVPKNKPLTIGVSGLGVTTHLAAIELQETYPNLTVVPFKSSNDSMLSMVSGQTDLHVGFVSQAEQWTKDNINSDRRVNILGITGSKQIKTYKTLASQGFQNTFAQMNVGHILLVSNKFDEEKMREIHGYFTEAAKAKSVLDAYSIDYCEPLKTKYEDMPKFFANSAEYWKKLAGKVKLEETK
jgi:tripartite-type tricarboxylate transporter receptor subunit TctC